MQSWMDLNEPFYHRRAPSSWCEMQVLVVSRDDAAGTYCNTTPHENDRHLIRSYI